jgi:FkbM family methyltransferase
MRFAPAPPTKYVDFDGIKLTVSGDMDRHTTRVLDGRSDSSQTEFQAIKDFVTSEDVVLDIGAGSMACALLAAQRASRVIAYEPSPRMYALASANIDANRSLHIEAHLGWAISPDFELNTADLRLPAETLDEASFDHACPVDEGMRVTIHSIEPVLSVLQREKPSVVVIETAGMASALTRAIGVSPTSMQPRTVISRLRDQWESYDVVHQTISTMRLMGYQLSRSYLGCDGFVFQKPNPMVGGGWI